MPEWAKFFITSLSSIIVGTIVSFLTIKMEKGKQKLKIDILILVSRGVEVNKFKCVEEIYLFWESLGNQEGDCSTEQTVAIKKSNISTDICRKINGTGYACIYEKADDTGQRNVYLVTAEQHTKFKKWFY